MTRPTPAGRLVAAFGDVETMAAMYAPNIQWSLPAAMNLPRPMKGKEEVVTFNRQVWTVHYRADCTVTILDEVGDERFSAVRFIYRAHSNPMNKIYENEYTVFVRSGPEGIKEVFEGLDSAMTVEFLSGRPAGSIVAEITGDELRPNSYGTGR